MNTAMRAALLILAAMVFACPALAQKPEVFSDRDGAIRGYDPVAYFTQGAPVKGTKQFSSPWRGATWYFATAENRDKFASDPERYAPKYGGYCAFGVAEGYTVAIDPAAWSIVNNQLYLNYSQSVRSRWSKDIPGNIIKADTNWPRVLQR